jgi:Ca2+-binding RTX toxin-like protein
VGATANNNNDTLTSNSGVDTLTGGAGNDTFYVNNALDVVVDTSSTSTNLVSSTASFTLPTNVNELILTGAAALKGSANLGNDTLVANTGADTLVSGTSGADSLVGGSGSEIFIVNSTSDIVHDTSTTANNILETTVNFTLPTDVNTLVITGAGAIAGTGNSHTDSMVAGAGTDTLTAGSGVATMTGGAGNDTFVLTNTLDVVSDTYTTTSNVISSTVGYTLPTNINTLIFTGSGALQGKANAGNDSLTANTGSDTLVAGAGQDTLVAGTTGTDSLVGGTGNDIFVVNNTADKVTDASTTNSNTIESSVTYTLPTNVNTLILTGAGAIAGTGNAVADSIIASTGTDTLAAGSGVATLVGGSGNDTFVVNSASDVIQDTSSTSSNVVSSSVTYTLPTDVNRLILTGTSALAGTANSGNDTLTANTGADTLTSGLTGTDSLVAGTGADLFVVNNAADIVTVGGTHGVDTISSSVSYTASTNVADLILTGTSALTGTGNSIAGTITANSGADTLTAGTGADTLVGSSTGTDIFVVNSASDVVSVGTSGLADTIESSVSYTLPTNVQYLTLTGTSALTATGNSALDLLVGNTGADNLIGGTGIAALEGGRTAGADQIKALSNQAALIAGGGKATLTGGAYKDFYAAGLVSDSITTGATANVVSVNDGDGATTLAPTTSATNVLSLGAGIDTESLEFTKSGNNLVLTDGVAGDSVTFTNWYVGSADQDYTTLQVIEIASPDYNSGGGDSLRNKPIEAFNFTALVSAYIAAGSPSNWLLSNDMASASLTTSASADYGGDLAYYFGLNGNLTGVDLSDVSSVLTNSSYGTGTQTINSFGSISGGGGLHLLVKPPGAQPPITSPTASENEGAPIAPIEVAPSDPFQEIKTVGTAPSAGKSGVTPIAPIEVAPVDPFRELTTVGTATMEGKSGVTPTAPIELEPHEPFPYLPPPATAPHIPSGRLPMPRLPEISGLLSQITPRFGLEDFAVLARGSVEETRTAPSAKVPTAPPPKNYVDPINLAWLTMHGRLDQINERILGGIEGAELDEGSHLTALMGATPHTPLRRNISVLELARGPGRHSAS